MRSQGIPEAEACARLRKAAMDNGSTLAKSAQRVVDVADLLA